MGITGTYTVSGMTCGHCAVSVTEEVRGIHSVEDVTVTLDSGRLTITSAEPLHPIAVRAAVEDAGYQLA